MPFLFYPCPFLLSVQEKQSCFLHSKGRVEVCSCICIMPLFHLGIADCHRQKHQRSRIQNSDTVAGIHFQGFSFFDLSLMEIANRICFDNHHVNLIAILLHAFDYITTHKEPLNILASFVLFDDTSSHTDFNSD